ncbi:MAG: hypothetical protein ACTSYV_03880, partial [Candidatus Heimdallarchaeaceae archaeon]
EFTSSDWVKTIKLKKEEIKKYVSLEKLKLSYDFTTEELDLEFLPVMESVRELTIKLLVLGHDDEYYEGSGYDGEWTEKLYGLEMQEHIVDLKKIGEKLPKLRKIEIIGGFANTYIQSLEPLTKLKYLEKLKLVVRSILDGKLYSMLAKCEKLRKLEIGQEAGFFSVEEWEEYDEGIEEEQMELKNVEEIILSGYYTEKKEIEEYYERKKKFFEKNKKLRKVDIRIRQVL